MKLKIQAEFTIDDPIDPISLDTRLKRVLTETEIYRIKGIIEKSLSGGELGTEMWKLGNYIDSEVINITLVEEYDTRE